MANENLQDPNASGEQEAKEGINRRAVAIRAGKFLAYTAPALIALMTAKDATALS